MSYTYVFFLTVEKEEVQEEQNIGAQGDNSMDSQEEHMEVCLLFFTKVFMVLLQVKHLVSTTKFLFLHKSFVLTVNTLN